MLKRPRGLSDEVLSPKMKQIEKVKEDIRNWLEVTSFVEFAEEIEKRVIAQPELRRACFIIYSYLQGIAFDAPVIKNNMLIAGPSGCGKTEFYRAIKDYFAEEGHPEIIVCCVDMTSITSPGFKGADPSDILKEYRQHQASITGFGIIILDEFDKRLIPVWGGSSGKVGNVSQEVQNGLLKIIEGADITLLSGATINTERLCFIGMGSFEHFRRNHAELKEVNTHVIGFNRDTEIEIIEKEKKEREDPFKPITKEDILNGGGTVELLARFSEVINFKPMSGECVDVLIEKVRKDVADSFLFTDVQLTPEIIAYLRTQVNTKFGVRYLDELIRGAVITASMDFHTSKESNDMTEDDMLVIVLHNQDNYSYHVRKMTAEEKEYYVKFCEHSKVECVDVSQDAWD